MTDVSASGANRLNERGLRDGLASLVDIRRSLRTRLITVERNFAEAEMEMLALRKLLGFVDQQQVELREQLRRIEEAQK